MATQPLFNRITLIGAGLIGSSLARVIQTHQLASQLTVTDEQSDVLDKVGSLALADEVTPDAAQAVQEADLVMLCTPLSAYGTIMQTIAPHLKPDAVISDVGSVKASAIDAITPHLPAGVHFVPGHPIAGTEKSGPAAGFATLFQNHWCILTPTTHSAPEAIEKITALWQAAGMRVEKMNAEHHDRTFALTSHLPHLIAYNLVGTALDFEKNTQQEVIKFSAGGFRDFTRIAASNPIMWRDIFLQNRDALLEMVEHFKQDLNQLSTAIRDGDAETLEKQLTRIQALGLAKD